MRNYKFIYFEDPISELMEIHKDSRDIKEIFQRDGEIHVTSIPKNFYIVLCFLGDRYLVTFAVDKDDLAVFRQQIEMDVDYKTIMMDIAMKNAFSDILNFKSLQRIESGFLTYLKEEFYEI